MCNLLDGEVPTPILPLIKVSPVTPKSFFKVKVLPLIVEAESIQAPPSVEPSEPIAKAAPTLLI